jgi:hypothetical protein
MALQNPPLASRVDRGCLRLVYRERDATPPVHGRVRPQKTGSGLEPTVPRKRPIHIEDAMVASDTDTGDFTMIRNTVLGLTAAAALVTAALAPTTASAHYYGGYGYKSYHYAPSYSYGHSYGYKSYNYGYKSYGYGYRSYGY